MKILQLFVLMSLLIAPTLGQSGEKTFKTRKNQACGGTIIMNEDCSDNKHRPWHVSCCPEGYRVQGIHWAKHTQHDTIDTLSSYCRSVTQGNKATDNDDLGQESRINSYCHKTEILTGLVWKDKVTKSGHVRDSMVDVSAVCLNPSNGKKRILKSMKGSNPNYQSSVNLPKRVVGLAVKEHLFDTADCAAIVVK